jgi:hypothetical protein
MSDVKAGAYRKLTDQDRTDILALKGQVTALGVAERYNVPPNTVYAIWQQRYRAGVLGRPKQVMTPEIREKIIQMKAAGARMGDMMEATGFGECTINMVVRNARAEGDPRVAKPLTAAQAAALRRREQVANVELPVRMVVRLSSQVQRTRDSLKARGLSHEAATREALRVCAAGGPSQRLGFGP